MYSSRDQRDWVQSLETETEISFNSVSISRPRPRLFSCSLNNETETETFFSESQLRDRDRDFFCQISRSRLRPRLPLVSKSRPRPRFFRDSCKPLESSILRAQKFDSNLTMIETEGVPVTKKSSPYFHNSQHFEKQPLILVLPSPKHPDNYLFKAIPYLI